ncbi:MAG TPA: LamG domain-containing protein, partial [Polyangia bacterium]|nr:LamG domain-containing protein [Polyangia bacterium]
AEVIRPAGQPFNNLTLNGSGATWTLEDWLKVNSGLTMTTGALSPGSYAIHVSDMNKTSGTFTAGTGTVVIDTTSDVTQSTGFSFNNLRVETPDETGLVGYWKFDEGQGTTVRDASGTGNDGTLSGNANWTESSLPSIAFDNHNAVTFNGTTAYGTIGVTSQPAASAARSMTAWVNLGSTSGIQDMISYRTAANSTVIGMGIRGGNIAAWGGGGVVFAQVAPPATGSWHHVAYTFDGTTHSMYLDGGTPGTGTTSPTGGTIGLGNIGSREGTSEFFSGSLDDLRVYNVALTAAQVKNLAAGRYSGKGSNTVVTLGAASSASGALSIDNGTLYSNASTMNASSSSNVVSVGSGATYHVGSATQTMSGGLTVYDQGTLTLDTASGVVALGNNTTFTMNGILNASSTSAAIQAVTGAGNKYTFNIGTTPTSTPTLNITGLQVKNTTANGMYINTDTSSVTTFTRFDNIAFSVGASTAANNYNLRIYAPSLYLTSNGCTFDNGVSATVANNVKLTGNGTADGETRIMFGNATCASDKASCEAYDADDDSAADGVGDNPGNGGDGAVIQWIRSAQADTSGSIEGFPTAAFDWSSFTYYSTYVGYHDSNGTADRVYVRTTTGSAATATYYWESASGDDIIGSPRWDTVSGVHYVYVATTSCKIYRLIDSTTNHTLTQDNTSPWDSTNNPYIYPTGCTITSPLAQDSTNLYWAGTTTVGSTPKLWTLSKTARTLPTGSPLNTTVTSNNTAPAIWVSGHTFSFMGLTGEIAKVDITAMSAATMNTNPGNGIAVTGRITVIANTLYAGDDNGFMWSINPADPNFAGTPKNWGYHDAGCASNCQVKSHYVDAQYSRVYYGNQAGKVYVINSSGNAVTGYPYLVNTTSEAFATAPLYR